MVKFDVLGAVELGIVVPRLFCVVGRGGCGMSDAALSAPRSGHDADWAASSRNGQAVSDSFTSDGNGTITVPLNGSGKPYAGDWAERASPPVGELEDAATGSPTPWARQPTPLEA